MSYYEKLNLPPQPWLHLLEPHWLAWRENEFSKGSDPDAYIEAKLKEAGVWPRRPSRNIDA